MEPNRITTPNNHSRHETVTYVLDKRSKKQLIVVNRRLKAGTGDALIIKGVKYVIQGEAKVERLPSMADPDKKQRNKHCNQRIDITNFTIQVHLEAESKDMSRLNKVFVTINLDED